ncbi:hypothetical protein RIF29_06270 [Crotalaria pallida]|uniref:Uncharacterized protein n=1 Tax=Crotalaria pallida TaxID=3830 RepID=A0AAN9J304_CROPI
MLSIDILTNMVQSLPAVFPSLKKLRLEGSNLKMIPKSIEKCCLLKDLSVKDSKQLNEITGLPQNITTLNAINCPSLNIHAAATDLVLKRIFEYGCTIKRTFWLAGKRLPEWFDISNKGNSLRFWFRNRIPDITVGLVAWGANRGYDYYFKINNGFEISCSNFFSHSCLEPEEIFISNDLCAIVSSRSTLPLLDEWNYAEISFVQSSNSYHLEIEPVRWSAVYVNRQNFSMEDIQFTNPYPADCEHQEMAQGESSQADSFAMAKNFQAQSPALSSGEVKGEPSLNQVESDEEMEAFYASLEVEKTREALKIVQDFMSNDASILLHPEQCTVLKTNLDFLSNNLTEDDVISREVITLISEASREFNHWSKDYTEASIKVASISCELLRAEELEAALKDNMEQYKDAVAKENVHQRKRDIFEKGKMLKTRRDDLREKIPHLQHEHCLAKETQTRIEDEWSKLRENLKMIFID